jgi:hypothetical protein
VAIREAILGPWLGRVCNLPLSTIGLLKPCFHWDHWRYFCLLVLVIKAGRYGRNLFRRRCTATLISAKPHGSARYHFVDAGWLGGSTLRPLHVVISRKGRSRKILGLVTDAPELSAAGLIQAYD